MGVKGTEPREERSATGSLPAAAAACDCQLPCLRLPTPPPAYVDAVRIASLARHHREAARIQLLKPRLCRNALSLALLYAAWISWTIAAPLGLWLGAQAHEDEGGDPDTLRAVAYALFASGLAYLAVVLTPILTKGMLCRPPAPANAGPFALEQVALQPDEVPDERGRRSNGSASASASPSPSPPVSPPPSSAVRVLEPQDSSRRVSVRGRCVWVLYNAHGNNGAKAKAKADMCTQRLQQAGACVHAQITQYAGHLYDLGRDPVLLPLEAAAEEGDFAADADCKDAPSSSSPHSRSAVAAVVIVGGDGSFSEYVNGYLDRAWKAGIPPERRTPVCLIPGGTGNSLARDLYWKELDAHTALDCMLGGADSGDGGSSVVGHGGGCVKLLDVCSLRDQGGLHVLSTNVVSWGLVGDTAVVAEDYRAFGDARYDVCAVWFLLRQITSRGSFIMRNLSAAKLGHNVLRGVEMKFKEAKEEEAGREGGDEGKEHAQTPNSNGASAPLPSTVPTPPDAPSCSPPFSRRCFTLSGEVTTAFFSCTQHFAKGLRAAPHACLDDGHVDVLTADGGLQRRALMTMFQQLPSGAHLHHEAVSYVQCQQVQLLPPPSSGEGEAEDEEDEGVDASAAAVLPSGSSSPRRPLGPGLRPYVINVDGENKVVRGALDVRCIARQMPVFAPMGMPRARS